MRVLMVMTDVGAIFDFEPSLGRKIETAIIGGNLRVGQAQPDPDRDYQELARFNNDRWAWYRWQEATEPSDD